MSVAAADPRPPGEPTVEAVGHSQAPAQVEQEYAFVEAPSPVAGSRLDTFSVLSLVGVTQVAWLAGLAYGVFRLLT